MTPEQEGFWRAPLKEEGKPDDPDNYTWECDLDKCATCRARYDRAKAAWRKYQEERK